jgi:hypothetical protein
MGKMEQTLKSEITRLASKQVRAACLPLAKDVRRLKRAVSVLRKTVTTRSAFSGLSKVIEGLPHATTWRHNVRNARTG